MIKLAKIININKHDVTLRLEQERQCSGCKSHCKDGFMNFLFHKSNEDTLIVARSNKSTDKHHLVDNGAFFSSDFKIDDVIGIKFNESELFKLSLLLYGLPIILIVLTLIGGYLIFAGLGLNADIGGIAGLVMGLLFSKYLIKSSSLKAMPRVKFFR
ncbi:MAG: SoxR reducing system RseC family protein [Alcanivoracaceae bacterium]|nr:SoxR reducing system RseC family protein [Alcanivoracaceae bacterium]